MFTGLEHTAIASPDPGRLANWYVEHLGFRINFVYAGNYFVRAPNGAVLEIIPAEGERGCNEMRTPGIRHLAVSVDDFDGALDVLRKRDVKMVGDPFQNQGNRLAFFTDVDGNLLHLIHRETPLP
jgi:glyoxylase I family protein